MKLIKEVSPQKNKNGHRVRMGLFLCEVCNKTYIKKFQASRYKTCGCVHGRSKHGMEGSRIIKIWRNMRERCYNPKDISYKNYGGRGILVCEEWRDFEVFMFWAYNNGYSDDLTIDRKNNNIGYTPDNCRFITQKENNRNRQWNKLNMAIAEEIRVEYSSGGYSQRRLSEKYGVSQNTIWNVVNSKIWVD